MVRWDVFAAIVALVGIPLMLNPSTIWVLKALVFFLARFLLQDGAYCERLEWRDIPAGLLHECDRNCTTSCDNLSFRHYEQEIHTDKDCFGCPIAKAFHRCWISSARREQRVRKPIQLDLKRKYIRTD